jgi:hypothetical protein
MRVVVTGSEGELGKRVIPFLAKEFTISEIKEDPGFSKEEYLKKCRDKLEGQDCIVHLAGNKDLGQDWSSAFENNIELTSNILEIAKEARVRKVILASSVFVVLDDEYKKGVGFDECSPYKPPNPYALSKACCELFGKYFSEKFDMNIISLRMGWVTSPSEVIELWPSITRIYCSIYDFQRCLKRIITSETPGYRSYYIVSSKTDISWEQDRLKMETGFTPIHDVYKDFNHLLLHYRIKRIPQVMLNAICDTVRNIFSDKKVGDAVHRIKTNEQIFFELSPGIKITDGTFLKTLDELYRLMEFHHKNMITNEIIILYKSHIGDLNEQVSLFMEMVEVFSNYFNINIILRENI